MSSQDGRARRFAHRRAEILEAATAHVVAHGLAGLSLRRVAEDAGVSHAALLQHFGTKDRLVAEIVDTIIGAALLSPSIAPDDPDPLGSLWRAGTSPSGRGALTAFLEITVTAARQEGDLRRAVAQSIADRERLLAEGLRLAGCPDDDAPAVAAFVLACLRGLMLDYLVTGREDSAEAALDVLRQAVAARLTG